jgi:hypothetical protein
MSKQDDYFIKIRLEQMDKHRWWYKVFDREIEVEEGMRDSKKKAIKRINNIIEKLFWGNGHE